MHSFIFCYFQGYMQDTKFLETVYIWFHPHEAIFFSHLINSVLCHQNCLRGSLFIVHETSIKNGLMCFLTLRDLHTILSTHTSFSSIVLDAHNFVIQEVPADWSARGIQCFVGGGMKS